MKKLVFVLMFLVLAGNVFAETPSKMKIKVPEVVTVEVPGAGPDQVVEIPYPVFVEHEVELPSAAGPVTNNVTQIGSHFVLRGGPSLGFSSQGSPSYTGGLVGELGRSNSPWRMQGTFRIGRCDDERIALEGGAAVTRVAAKHFRIGVGVDLAYCSDYEAHPIEQATERVVSAAIKAAYEFGPLVLEGSFGGGFKTIPIPGDRDTRGTLVLGISLSYLFGN